MSHDRGCYCGREPYEYRNCPLRDAKKGCAKDSVIEMWDKAKKPTSGGGGSATLVVRTRVDLSQDPRKEAARLLALPDSVVPYDAKQVIHALLKHYKPKVKTRGKIRTSRSSANPARTEKARSTR